MRRQRIILGGEAMGSMTGLDLMDALTLLASVLVLFYLAAYAVTRYFQIRRGIKWDWRTTSVFYVGIAFLAVANILQAVQGVYYSSYAKAAATFLYLASLLVFIYGMHHRAKSSHKIMAFLTEEELGKLHGKKAGKKKR